MIATQKKRVAVFGISFKSGTDDLRESPQVELVERLLGKGFDIRLYDRNVKLASLIGANRRYIMEVIPHISRLLADTVDEALVGADVVIIGNNDPEFASLPDKLSESQILLDLVRIGDVEPLGARYDGVNW